MSIGEQIFTDKDPIDEVLPTHGWLREYTEFGKGLETCTRFRFFTACCMLGAAVNNRVWIQRGDENLLPKLFPNLWVLLLAPPGRGHKTSTINMGVNCLQQGAPECRIMSDKLTPESLVKALSEPSVKEQIRIGPRDATGLIKAPELSVFFGKQQYNVGLVSLITDLYDFKEEWASETIMRGKSILKNVCISIIGGSTPDWLQSMLPQDAFTGGFMSRFVIVEMPQTYLKRCALPRQTSRHDWAHVIRGFNMFRRIKGQMQWTDRCKKAYIDHYESMIPSGEVQRDAYQERETEQILKLSMLLALSEGEMTVRRKHIHRARSLLNCLMQETAPRIERLATHPRMHLVQEIQDLLRKHKALRQSQMLKKMYRGLSHGEPQFYEALRVLKVSGIIKADGNGVDPVLKLDRRAGRQRIRVR